MADEPSKKKRRKNAPTLGRRPRGKNQKSRPPALPANLDVNPALDDDVGPRPNNDDDHTIIRIGGPGESDRVVRPAPDDPDPRADPAAADAVVEAAPADDQPAARLAPGRASKSKSRRRGLCGLCRGRSRNRPAPTLSRRVRTTPRRVWSTGKSNFWAPSLVLTGMFNLNLPTPTHLCALHLLLI